MPREGSRGFSAEQSISVPHKRGVQDSEGGQAGHTVQQEHAHDEAAQSHLSQWLSPMMENVARLEVTRRISVSFFLFMFGTGIAGAG